MTDAVVTVVRCRRCGRTGDLTLRDEQFWCAWCQDRALLAAESVDNAIVVPDDRTGRPKLARRPDEWFPLQPLRIPQGWTMTYGSGLFEIDPSPDLSEDERLGAFEQDMVQMRHESPNRLLDIGWYGDIETGRYGLVVYEGDFHGRLLHEFRTRDRLALVAETERLLMLVSEGKL